MEKGSVLGRCGIAFLMSPAQLLEQALFRLDVCVIEFTLLRFLKLERQRLDSPHELHELSSFRAWPRRAVRDAHVCPPTLINGTSVLRGGGGSHPPVDSCCGQAATATE